MEFVWVYIYIVSEEGGDSLGFADVADAFNKKQLDALNKHVGIIKVVIQLTPLH